MFILKSPCGTKVLDQNDRIIPITEGTPREFPTPDQAYFYADAIEQDLRIYAK